MRQLALPLRAYVDLRTGARRYVDTWERSHVPAWTPPQLPDGFDATRPADCPVFRAFVEEHPDGATFAEIGRAIGMTKEGVHGVFRRAMKRVLAGLRADAETVALLREEGVDLEEAQAPDLMRKVG